MTSSLPGNPSGSLSKLRAGNRSCHAGPFITRLSQRALRHLRRCYHALEPHDQYDGRANGRSSPNPPDQHRQQPCLRAWEVIYRPQLLHHKNITNHHYGPSTQDLHKINEPFDIPLNDDLFTCRFIAKPKSTLS